jgi:hypothetical protein
MLKKIAVFRLGSQEMLTADSLVLTPLVLENDQPLIGVANPIGFISLVLTDKSPAQIARAYQMVAEMTEDVLPVLVWELDSPETSYNFVADQFEQFNQMVTIFNQDCQAFLETQTKVTHHNMTLDDLLDIANERGGIDKLTEDEAILLAKLSAQ